MPNATPVISRRLITDQLETRLKTLIGVTVYRGEVPGGPPIIQKDGHDDPSGRVAKHIVIHSGAGTPVVNGEADVADTHHDLTGSWVITCTAGYEADCLHTVDLVHAVLYRWSPVINGLAFGRMRPPLGFDPGQARVNTGVKPPRYYLPLQYRLDVTT